MGRGIKMGALVMLQLVSCVQSSQLVIEPDQAIGQWALIYSTNSLYLVVRMKYVWVYVHLGLVAVFIPIATNTIVHWLPAVVSRWHAKLIQVVTNSVVHTIEILC